MTARNPTVLALLGATSSLALASSPAIAQAQPTAQSPAAQPAPTQVRPAPARTSGGLNNPEDLEDEAIVVTGQRERGAVIGDVKPVQQLDAGDVRALGVSSVNDILTELGPQVQSASGRPPVMLLEGHRLSSPQEIGSLPSEAIQRIDVLPEEAGLRYGYGADQKVVNIVLRQRFRALSAEVNARVPTRKAGKNGQGDFGFLSIRNGRRLNFSTQVKVQERVLETDRGLNNPDSPYRTLSGSDTQLTTNGTYHFPVSDRVAATINGEVTTDQQDSLTGRSLFPVTIPANTPYNMTAAAVQFTPQSPVVGALERTSSRQTVHGGFAVTRDHAHGQMTLTGNFDHGFTRQISDRPFDLSAYAAAVAAGTSTANPANPIASSFLVGPSADVSRSYTDTGSLDLLYNTSLFTLPAGDVALTTHVSGITQTFRTSRLRDMIDTRARVHRDDASFSGNFSIPITGAGMPIADTIGRLSINGNYDLDYLSDAGTTTSFGFGLNWQLTKKFTITGNFTDRETAPTPNQLGDAPVVTVNVPIFDYVRGETVNVQTISGGNPNLANAKTNSFRLGLSWAPLKDPQLNFQFDLSHNRTTGGIASLPGITLDTQTAFASRFTRLPLGPNDTTHTVGVLSQVDLRPINITEQKNTQLRWGLNFTMQLKTPQSQVRAFQEVARKRIEERLASGQIPPEIADRLRQALATGQFPGQGGQGQGQRPAGQGAAQAGGQQAGQTQAAQGKGAQQGQQGQQGTPGQPVIVVQGNPDAAGAAPPGGGNFVFRGPGGPGGGGFPGGGGGGGGFRGGGGFGGGFGGGGFGGGGFGGGGGGNNRTGRLNFSLYHTWILDQTTQLAPILPVIDLLNGGTLGGGAGPSQHQIQFQGGYTQGGLGFRTFINWNSATHVNGTSGPTSVLRFGALARTNLRVFMNFQQLPKLVDKVPFLRGARLQFGVDNLFDARQKVTDGNGATPFAYSPAYLDRTGRVFSVGFRKLFF